MDGSKCTGRKVGYAALIIDTTRRSLHSHSNERVDIRWVIYTDSLSSILAIENNRENQPILNQIYDN